MDLQQRGKKSDASSRSFSRIAVSYCILAFNILNTTLIAQEPWGKDADLTWNYPKQVQEVSNCETPLLGPFGEWMIAFHQEIISPADGPRSHYFPSSSQYTLEAMRRYGFLKGYIMGCDRLMRENGDPWIYPITLDPGGNALKYDPVK